MFSRKQRPGFGGRLLFRPGAAAAQDVVKCNRTAAKKHQREGNRSHCERELESTFAHQSVVPMDFPDGYAQIDTDGEGGQASEESDENHEAAKELSEGRQVGRPSGQSEAGDKLSVMMKSAEDL